MKKRIAQLLITLFFSLIARASNLEILEEYLTKEVKLSTLEGCRYNFNIPTISEGMIKNIRIISKNDLDEYLLNVQIENANSLVEKRIKVKVIQICNYPVLIKKLNKGEIIQEENITFIEHIFQKSKDVIMDEQGLYNQEVRRNILAGKLIKASDIQKRELIKKNQQVTVLYRNNGMALKIVGIALESGKEGQLIKVKNERTNVTLVGEILDENTVLVKK